MPRFGFIPTWSSGGRRETQRMCHGGAGRIGDAGASLPAARAAARPRRAAAPAHPARRPAATGARRQAAASSACMVTDTGGINDRSFNASAWAGMQVAAAASSDSTSRQYLQSSTPTSDYTPNINTFIGEKLRHHRHRRLRHGATPRRPRPRRTRRRSSRSSTTPTHPPLKNVDSAWFQHQPGRLPRRLPGGGHEQDRHRRRPSAAQNIPPVTIYMDGFGAGVRYYNMLNTRLNVQVLGWNEQSLPGTGCSPMTSPTRPWARPTPRPSSPRVPTSSSRWPAPSAWAPPRQSRSRRPAAAVNMEWVDTDGCVSAPQYCKLFITSVTKGITRLGLSRRRAAAKGTFKGGNYTGDLANNGVALLARTTTSPARSRRPCRPSSSKIKAGIIAGKISSTPTKYPIRSRSTQRHLAGRRVAHRRPSASRLKHRPGARQMRVGRVSNGRYGPAELARDQGATWSSSCGHHQEVRSAGGQRRHRPRRGSGRGPLLCSARTAPASRR